MIEELDVALAYVLGAGVCVFLGALLAIFFRAPADMEREAAETAATQINDLRARVDKLEAELSVLFEKTKKLACS